MPDYLIKEETLTNMANSVRTLSGNDISMTPDEMVEQINISKNIMDSMDQPIGSLLVSAFNPGSNYLSTQNPGEVFNVSDYPTLYNNIFNYSNANGYREIDTLPTTVINKFGYNNGLWWCAYAGGYYYKTNLNDSSWTKATLPNTSWTSTYADCVNNIFFYCGTYGDYGRIAYSTDLKNWTIVPTTSTNPLPAYGPNAIYYINNSYVFRMNTSSNYVRFYRYPSLNSYYADTNYFNYTSTPGVEIAGINGYWWFSFDTSSGSIYHQIKNGTTTFSNTTTILSCTNKCDKIKIKYENNNYYLYTADGIYKSSLPNSGFTLISSNGNGASLFENTNKTDKYYFRSTNYTSSTTNADSAMNRGHGFIISEDLENTMFLSVLPNNLNTISGNRALFYDSNNNNMYAVINGVLYLNDNSQFNIPYISLGDNSYYKTYIKAK